MKPSRLLAGVMASPLVLVLVVGVVIPAGTFLVYSFFTFALRRPQPGFTLSNYVQALTSEVYRPYVWNTILIAVPTTIGAVLGGFLIAHFLAFRARRSKMPILGLVVVALLGSYLARIYAWRALLGKGGVVNGVLQVVWPDDPPEDLLLFTRTAVIVAEINLLMPLTTLLIYTSLVGVPNGVRESARDLGARSFEVLRRVTMPLCGAAVLAATAFSFFLSAGDYITPVLLGGTSSGTVGTLISDQLRVSGNYALGGALAFVTVSALALFYVLLRLVFRRTGLLPVTTT